MNPQAFLVTGNFLYTAKHAVFLSLIKVDYLFLSWVTFSLSVEGVCVLVVYISIYSALPSVFTFEFCMRASIPSLPWYFFLAEISRSNSLFHIRWIFSQILLELNETFSFLAFFSEDCFWYSIFQAFLWVFLSWLLSWFSILILLPFFLVWCVSDIPTAYSLFIHTFISGCYFMSGDIKYEEALKTRLTHILSSWYV